MVLAEDFGALVGLALALTGVGLAALTGNLLFDALATLAIGLLLLVIAAVLVLEMRSLLLGEAATEEQVDEIRTALRADGVQRVLSLRTMHLGPDDLLVAAKIEMTPGLDVAGVAAGIDRAEARVRAAVPAARLVFLEPDLYRRQDVAPSPADPG